MRNLPLIVLVAAGCMTEDPLEASEPEALQGTACEAEEPALAVPLSHSDSGLVLHWHLPGECVPTRFDPALEHRAAELQAAIDVWNDISCSQLCFAPLVGGEPSGDERAVYFQLDPSAEVDAAVTTRFGAKTGRLWRVEVWLADPPDGDDDLGDLLWSMGRAVGLASPPKETISAMNGGGETPTEADIETVCTLYGDTPLCESTAR